MDNKNREIIDIYQGLEWPERFDKAEEIVSQILRAMKAQDWRESSKLMRESLAAFLMATATEEGPYASDVNDINYERIYSLLQMAISKAYFGGMAQ